MPTVKLHIKSIEINESASLSTMQKNCPEFFATKFGKWETYTVYRGCLIVRNTRTFSDRIPRRLTIPYLFTMDLEGRPDFFSINPYGIDGVRAAKRLIDTVLDRGAINEIHSEFISSLNELDKEKFNG